mgnify:CR=1 FL=1
MNNKGFEIKLNDELLCKAGIKHNHGVVTCIFMAVLRKEDKKQELRLDITGLNSDTDERNKWLKDKELNHDDIISIRIIEDGFDLPEEVTKRNCSVPTLEQKIKKYHQLKEELKDYL